MAARISQNLAESVEQADNGKARITQNFVESLEQADNGKARITQAFVESLEQADNGKARITQVCVEVVHTGACADPVGCPAPWTPPTPDPYPVPSLGGPLYLNFDEKTPDWGNFGQQFPDQNPEFNTLQSARVRFFIFAYEGLSQAEVNTIEKHYESTRRALSFSLTHPRTAEVITKVRYIRRPNTDHRRSWARTFTVELAKYSN